MTRLIFYMLSFLALQISAQQAWAAQKKIIFCTHLGFEPYVIKDQKKLSGIDIDIVHELIERAHLDAEITLLPWARLLHSLQNGSCDAGFSLFDSDPRRHYVDYIFSAPIHVSNIVLFTRKGKEFRFEKISDIYNHTIAYNRGFRFSHELNMSIENRFIPHQEYDNLKSAISMLLAGRIDAILENEVRVNYFLKSYGVEEKLSQLNVPFMPLEPAFLVLSKKTQVSDPTALKWKLEKILSQMSESGRLKEITEKYTD